MTTDQKFFRRNTGARTALAQNIRQDEPASAGFHGLISRRVLTPGAASVEALLMPDTLWDAIVRIEPDGEDDVYDLTVPSHHNFVADNIVVHNSIEQDADVVMFLYRDVVYNKATEFPNQADVIVSKHRNGRTDTVQLYFDASLTKFMDGAVRRVSMSE